MKWKLIILMLLLSTTVNALEECKSVMEPSDVPCLITSLWNYTPPCNQYNATVWYETGSNIINYTFSDYGSSGLCNFTWNITELGSYIYQVSNGDSGTIHIGADNLMLGLTIGVGIIIALLLVIAFNLGEDMTWIKIYLIFSSLFIASIIPATFIIHDTSVIFHKAYQWFLRITFGFVFIYLTIKFFTWMGLIVPNEGGKQ